MVEAVIRWLTDGRSEEMTEAQKSLEDTDELEAITVRIAGSVAAVDDALRRLEATVRARRGGS